MIKSKLFLVIATMIFFSSSSPLIAKECGSPKSKPKQHVHHSHGHCCKEIKNYLQQYIECEISKVTCLLLEIKKCCKKDKKKDDDGCYGRPNKYDRYGHCEWRDNHKQCGLHCGSY